MQFTLKNLAVCTACIALSFTVAKFVVYADRNYFRSSGAAGGAFLIALIGATIGAGIGAPLGSWWRGLVAGSIASAGTYLILVAII